MSALTNFINFIIKELPIIIKKGLSQTGKNIWYNLNNLPIFIWYIIGLIIILIIFSIIIWLKKNPEAWRSVHY